MPKSDAQHKRVTFLYKHENEKYFIATADQYMKFMPFNYIMSVTNLVWSVCLCVSSVLSTWYSWIEISNKWNNIPICKRKNSTHFLFFAKVAQSFVIKFTTHYCYCHCYYRNFHFCNVGGNGTFSAAQRVSHKHTSDMDETLLYATWSTWVRTVIQANSKSKSLLCKQTKARGWRKHHHTIIALTFISHSFCLGWQ